MYFSARASKQVDSRDASGTGLAVPAYIASGFIP